MLQELESSDPERRVPNAEGSVEVAEAKLKF